jgi:hypothetical protein
MLLVLIQMLKKKHFPEKKTFPKSANNVTAAMPWGKTMTHLVDVFLRHIPRYYS